MWTLLEATFYLTFAVFSPSSVFLILSFKKPALETNCASTSVIFLSNKSSLSEAFSCSQTIPSDQTYVDNVTLLLHAD